MRDQPDRVLAALLKEMREERKITQEQLAFNAEMTASALSRIERGLNNPGWTTVTQLAKALGITLVELASAVEDARSG